ncbi:hypothetical protein AB0N17_39495 [Streptomyces sp. NPDC051133]
MNDAADFVAGIEIRLRSAREQARAVLDEDPQRTDGTDGTDTRSTT